MEGVYKKEKNFQNYYDTEKGEHKPSNKNDNNNKKMNKSRNS